MLARPRLRQREHDDHPCLGPGRNALRVGARSLDVGRGHCVAVALGGRQQLVLQRSRGAPHSNGGDRGDRGRRPARRLLRADLHSTGWSAAWTSPVKGAPYEFQISVDSGYTGPGTYEKGQFRFTIGPETTSTDSSGQTITQGNSEYSVLTGTVTTDAGDASGTLDVGMEHGLFGHTLEVLHIRGRWTCQFS